MRPPCSAPIVDPSHRDDAVPPTRSHAVNTNYNNTDHTNTTNAAARHPDQSGPDRRKSAKKAQTRK